MDQGENVEDTYNIRQLRPRTLELNPLIIGESVVCRLQGLREGIQVIQVSPFITQSLSGVPEAVPKHENYIVIFEEQCITVPQFSYL